MFRELRLRKVITDAAEDTKAAAGAAVSCSDKGETDMINFEEEIERFKPSLEVEAVSDAIVKSDLTDMADIMMDIMKDIKKEK